jgi:magnesium-transporting ATPase (P-type)
MGKYSYIIKIHSVQSIEQLQEVMNTYASEGYRVISVSRTDNVLYEGRIEKYTLYLEKKKK